MGKVEPLWKDEQQEGELIDFKTGKKKVKGEEIKYRKDKKPKRTKSNSVKGKHHAVYPIKDEADIEKMKQFFRNRISKADTPEKKKIAGRDLLLFCFGINIGLRCGDIVSLKWGEILNENKEFYKGIRRQEQKTKKYKTFFLNQSTKDAFTEYINQFKPCLDSDNYVFKSREGGHIQVRTMGDIIKKAGIECGIGQPLSSHSLRKTFGYHFYTKHLDDVRALTHLQRLFAHSNQAVTLAYIGIEDEETEEFYNNLNL